MSTRRQLRNLSTITLVVALFTGMLVSGQTPLAVADQNDNFENPACSITISDWWSDAWGGLVTVGPYDVEFDCPRASRPCAGPGSTYEVYVDSGYVDDITGGDSFTYDNALYFEFGTSSGDTVNIPSSRHAIVLTFGGKDEVNYGASGAGKEFHILLGGGGDDEIPSGAGYVAEAHIWTGTDNNAYIVYGTDGDDFISAKGTEGGSAYGEDGDDTIEGGSGPDSLYGGDGADLVYGGDHIDSLYSNDGVGSDIDLDCLCDGEGDGTSAYPDLLQGDGGVDKITGGPDYDTMNGAGAADYIDACDWVATELSDTVDGGSGTDRAWRTEEVDNLSNVELEYDCSYP